ncbi:MAG: membrane protein insertion efficiency factor YidD [Alphaproteobacteria bacterium]|nr:MAG: membrane protein insertion efficiency factor YidD [Alphaproteobacteria bacterium]
MGRYRRARTGARLQGAARLDTPDLRCSGRRDQPDRGEKIPGHAVNPLHAPRLAGRGLVKIYRYTLSPLVGFHCRHLPTCSEYADEALDRYGLWAGSWMTLARLLRCQPLGTSGIDRVPETAPQGARWYAPWRYARWSWVQRTD